MSDQPWTLMAILNSAREYLERKGIENPRGNAEALLGKVLELPRIQLYLQYDRPLKSTQVDAYRELIRRRVAREPLQLLLGEVTFLNVTLEVMPGLLIPRPETEELAAEVVRRAQRMERPLRLLDIGTGTGCLAVSIAREVEGLSVVAADVDFDAVRCAAHNAERNGAGERVRTLRADVMGPRFLELVQPPFDIIVSNPPYVTETEYATLPVEVRGHERRHALVAAEQGLAFYRRIAGLLPTLLSPAGFAALEVGAGQHAAVAALLEDVVAQVDVQNDLAGIPRMVFAQNVKVTASSRQDS